MMLRRALPLPAAKEVRALLPLWLGCLAAVGVGAAARGSGLVSSAGLHAMGIFALAGASVTLGAFSIGHEYADRTLPLLLSQPGSRARLFLVKQSTLAVMLVILAGGVWSTVLFHSSVVTRLVVLSVLGGLFVAPWVTMLSRDALGGAVLSAPAAGCIWILVEVFVSPALKLAVFWWGMLALCAISALLGWRAFMRLEAIEGRGADMRFAMPATRLAPARDRRPTWLLVQKELALQLLTFAVVAVVGLYVVGWVITSLLGGPSRRIADDLIGAATFLYSGLLALLIGSLASAEERQLGTLEWQVLLPMASGKQGMVKAGVALGLAMLLAVGLPAVLFSVSGGHVQINEWYACTILLLTAVSLYTSSLSRNGVRALLLSLPVSLVVLFVIAGLQSTLRMGRLSPFPLVLFAAFVAVVLYLALLNHRSAERSAGRVCRQVFVLAGCIAFGAALLALVDTFHVRWLR